MEVGRYHHAPGLERPDWWLAVADNAVCRCVFTEPKRKPTPTAVCKIFLADMRTTRNSGIAVRGREASIATTLLEVAVREIMKTNVSSFWYPSRDQ